MTTTHTQPEDGNTQPAAKGQESSATSTQSPAVSPSLFTPIEAPEISGNLLADPRIAAILEPPADTSTSQSH